MNSASPTSFEEIRVKFLTKHPDEDVYPTWRSYLPGGNPLVGRCRFLFNRDERDYDWLVVYDDLPSVTGERFTLWEELLQCSPGNTMLITTEPASIKVYGRGFLNQFGWVLTSQEPWVVDHPGTIRCQPGLIRFYEGQHDDLINHPLRNKTQTISTVCSSKQQKHTLHHARYEFTQRLKAALPEIQVYGHGVRPISIKNEALDSFSYHVAIENHVAPHHWTEKLADPFIALSLPFYFGAPNAADYFPPDSFIPIDITRFDEAIATIGEAIANDEYTRRLPAIREARCLALEYWGTFHQLARLIEERHPPQGEDHPGTTPILSRHLLRRRHPIRSLGLIAERSYIALRFALSR